METFTCTKLQYKTLFTCGTHVTGYELHENTHLHGGQDQFDPSVHHHCPTLECELESSRPLMMLETTLVDCMRGVRVHD